MKLLNTLIVISAALMPATMAARTVIVKSPDNKIQATLEDGQNGLPTISVSAFGKTILEKSPIGLKVEDRKTPIAIKSVKKPQIKKEAVKAPFHHTPEFSIEYEHTRVDLGDGLAIELRAFNDGVAYRFCTTKPGDKIIVDEVAEYNLAGNPDTYLSFTTNDKKPEAMAFQNFYTVAPAKSASDKLAFLPAAADFGDGVKAVILESDLESYPGMFMQADSVSGTLKGVFAKYPKSFDFYPWRVQKYVTATEDYIAKAGKRNFPWRIISLTDDDTKMPTSNLVYALATPSRVADTSWIKPGKVAWDWWNDWGLRQVDFKAGINTDTYKYYIDFASENGIEYIVLDEGWYDPKSGDMLTVVPDINLPELIEYGKHRGVGIVLWTVFNVLDTQLEEACKKYSDMGIKGFKVDFLDRDDQEGVEMVYRICEGTAKHNLMLDLHGIYKPTGLNRTYPNVINFEAVFGMEEMKWSEPTVDMPMYDVTFPYLRMMQGPVDYTPGAMRNASKADWKAIYYNPMSQGTRGHQVATYIVIDSPFTMLADTPSNYLLDQECTDFITGLPTLFDYTKVLDGKMGQYIVTMRKHDGSWYVGGLTNWDPRDYTLDFSFLPAGKFRATILKDGINAAKQGDDHKIMQITVDNATKEKIHMAPGGGFAVRIDPLPPTSGKVGAVPSSMRDRIPDFYKKYVDTDGLYVVSSEKVSDEALKQACDIMGYMLMKRPDIKKHMVDRGAHVMIIGANEETCEIPEFKHICTDNPDSIAFWNWRARGFGGAPEDPLSSSCGEENILALPSDKYVGENILIHEFSHLIHQLGIEETDPTFDARLCALLEEAKKNGLWDNTYALSDKYEYFAEATQSFFNCNRYADPANGVHNNVSRRSRLKDYDPKMYDLLKEYFYEIDIPINNKIHR